MYLSLYYIQFVLSNRMYRVVYGYSYLLLCLTKNESIIWHMVIFT